MASVNEFALLGNLGADPEQSGPAVRLRIATSYKTKEGEERTDWHRVTAFGKSGEFAAKYLKKGSQVYVSGRIGYSKYEKNGEERHSTDLIADRVQGLDRKGSTEESPF